ncbi:nucleotidyl transferase AbiEii/AbiGii toxin family protein [Jiangella sp. DSM 45060]|uniref:nucleotidyl transferase AbiEii/AbiGii toxin family protein n=1 Tax=Jiangella sp. DSM 45060 TaxID=1798224 RepID=UPI00087A9262|nr:nucleotidyl transferase AbiEii/AbiGii toxin family protein [Jiangella sp. DSM 45060]SDT67659.1 hypothetical protein SAMN04515669_5753 [Jiangella sp. DSM 45060]
MTEPDGRHRTQYDPASADLVLAQAADIVRATGFAAQHLVLIGGLVPSLLVPVLDPGIEPHIGTADVDLCLSLALVDGDTGTYERIETILRRMGFVAGEASFRWVRRGDVPMIVEFFCPAGPDRPAGRIWRPKSAENPVGKQNLGGTLSALSLAAGGILTEDVELLRRDVVLPDGKGRVPIDLRCTGPVAFVVAKTQALLGRDKQKDAYDIVWLIESWPGGPSAAATAFAERPAFDAPETGAALDDLRTAFADVEAIGPRSYARFLATDPDEEAGLERRAVGAIEEFLATIPDRDVQP